jgi:hypothetical protein
MLEVVSSPLKAELILVVPDLVADSQHANAASLLSSLLEKDSQLTAPALESLSSLHLPPDDTERVVTLVAKVSRQMTT